MFPAIFYNQKRIYTLDDIVLQNDVKRILKFAMVNYYYDQNKICNRIVMDNETKVAVNVNI